jgi:amino-acid N-acetyltransferase
VISALTADFVREDAQAARPLELRKVAARGIMLPRTELEISESIRDFSVAFAGGCLVGCGALHFYSPAMGEIRSLAVREDAKSYGVGRQLVETLVNDAGEFSLTCVFAFTYVPDFFRKLAFEEVERGALPLKVWKDCVRCFKFQSCDEIAMMRVLITDKWLVSSPKCGYDITPNKGTQNALLPIICKQ